MGGGLAIDIATHEADPSWFAVQYHDYRKVSVACVSTRRTSRGMELTQRSRSRWHNFRRKCGERQSLFEMLGCSCMSTRLRKVSSI